MSEESITLSQLLCASPQRVTVAGTARLQNEAARLCDELESMTRERDTLRAELAAKEKALSSAKIALDAKDRSYSVIEQRFSAMAAKAATTDSERECNERLTAEIDALTAELTEAQRRLKEASEQEPVLFIAYKQFGGGYTKRYMNLRDTVEAHRIDGYEITPLYAAPVPQPAVPEALIKEAATYLDHFGRADLASELRAILSATDSEVKNGLR